MGSQTCRYAISTCKHYAPSQNSDHCAPNIVSDSHIVPYNRYAPQPYNPHSTKKTTSISGYKLVVNIIQQVFGRNPVIIVVVNLVVILEDVFTGIFILGDVVLGDRLLPWLFWFCFVLLSVNVAIARQFNCYREYAKVILYHGFKLITKYMKKREKMKKLNANIRIIPSLPKKPQLLLGKN